MNMVSAKMAPMTVQQTSVDFLFFSVIGNWSALRTRSSNIGFRYVEGVNKINKMIFK